MRIVQECPQKYLERYRIFRNVQVQEYSVMLWKVLEYFGKFSNILLDVLECPRTFYKMFQSDLDVLLNVLEYFRMFHRIF